MARRRSSTPEQIITKLREAEILLSQGKTVKEVLGKKVIAPSSKRQAVRQWKLWMSQNARPAR